MNDDAPFEHVMALLQAAQRETIPAGTGHRPPT